MSGFSLANWVAKRRASVLTKLLAALLGLVAALVILGGLGLGALERTSDRAKQIADQQIRIDRYRRVSTLAEQTFRVMGEHFLDVYAKPYGLDDENAPNPFAIILNNADWVESDIGDIKRSIRSEIWEDPEVERWFKDALEDLRSLVELSRNMRLALQSNDLKSAHAIFGGDARSLKRRIESQMFTLETQVAQHMQVLAAQAKTEFEMWQRRLILASCVAVILALLLGFAISASLVRPIRQIERRMDMLGTGEFEARLDVANRDELGELAEKVNRTSNLLSKLYSEISEKKGRLEELSKQLSRYLSPQVYASIFEGRQEAKVAANRKKLTVFFSDIADFTELTDRMEPEELTDLLNHYLTEMSQIALEHGATIDKYVGDAIIVFFGDPETRGVREDARACLRMAVSMRDRLKELEIIWRDRGIARSLKCRIGIHTDFCTVGNFGGVERLDYTIIGRGVNIASRLEALAEPGEILISFETYAHVRDLAIFTEQGEVDIRGLAYPIMSYKVESLKERD